MIIHIDLTLSSNFCCSVFLPLNRMFYQPFLAVSRQRTARIEAGVQAAEESQRRAEETARQVRLQLDGARAEAQGLIAASARDAATHRQHLLAEAKGEADALVESARGDIRSERDAAVQQVRAEVAPLAALIAARVTDGALDPAATRQAAESIMATQAAGARSTTALSTSPGRLSFSL